MEANWRYADPEAEALRIAAEIDQYGYGVMTHRVSDQELETARRLAVSAVAIAGGEYACFTGAEAVAGTVLADLGSSPPFQYLCQRLYELGTNRPAPQESFYQVFRCLRGRTGQEHSYRFHYDSYVLTALLPVAIPDVGPRGDLLILPNTRGIRHFYLRNVVDKVLLDNRMTQAILRLRAGKGALKGVSVRLEVGSVYFFWGYRSIHTNEPCDLDKLRATALFHYGDPHRDSWIRSVIRGGGRSLPPSAEGEVK